MTGAIELLAESGWSDAVIARQCTHLQDLQRWAWSIDIDEGESALARAAADADKFRKIVHVMKGAKALAVEATRLECICLRRLYQLGRMDALTSVQKGAARVLGELDDGDFAVRMVDMDPKSSAVGLARTIRAESTEEMWEGHRQAFRQTGALPTNRLHRKPYEVASSIFDILADIDDLCDDDEAHQVAEFVDLLRAVMGVDDTNHDRAMRRVIEEALDGAPPWDDNVRGHQVPRYVTVLSEDLGWHVLPFYKATVDDLRHFTARRHSRAEQAVNEAAVLDDLMAVVEELAEAHPDVPRCVDLLARAPRRR